MTGAEFLGIISGILTFWKEVKWLVKLLQGTPQEHKDAIFQKIQLEAEQFKKTTRPSWER